MLRSGFEPESSARKAGMIGRATPPEPSLYWVIPLSEMFLIKGCFYIIVVNSDHFEDVFFLYSQNFFSDCLFSFFTIFKILFILFIFFDFLRSLSFFCHEASDPFAEFPTVFGLTIESAAGTG
jgi:hypothetical protein